MNRPLRFALLVNCSKSPPPTPEPATEPDLAPPAMSTEFGDQASDVAVTTSGDVMVVGLTVGGLYGDIDFWFIRRYGAEGNLKWERRVDRCKSTPYVEGPIEPGSPDDCRDSSILVASDDADNTYVLNQTQGDAVTISYLSKYAADGILLWDKQVVEDCSAEQGQSGLIRHSGLLITDFAVGNDGNIYLIAPEAAESTNRQNATLLKYNADGLKLWEKPGGPPDVDKIVVSGKSVYTADVTINAPHSDKADHMTVLQKLTVSGDPLWTRTIPKSGHHEFASLAVSGEAHVYVVTGVGFANRDYNDGTATITKFSGAGALLWESILTPEPYWSLSEVAADGAGRLYLVGYAEIATVSETDTELSTFGYVLRYSPEGKRDWLVPLQGTGPRGVLGGDVRPIGVATTPTRDSYGNPQTRLYVAGITEDNGYGSSWPDDAFLLSADDRSDYPTLDDADDAYPGSLQAFWVNR